MKNLTILALLVALASVAGAQEPRFGKPLDPDDPLGDLAARMGSVTDDLGRLKTDEKVQQKQDDIITALDKLIEDLEKQSGS